MQEYSRRFTREYPPEFRREPGLTESTEYSQQFSDKCIFVIALWHRLGCNTLINFICTRVFVERNPLSTGKLTAVFVRVCFSKNPVLYCFNSKACMDQTVLNYSCRCQFMTQPTASVSYCYYDTNPFSMRLLYTSTLCFALVAFCWVV